jgi:hypothetical protein
MLRAQTLRAATIREPDLARIPPVSKKVISLFHKRHANCALSRSRSNFSL